MTGPRCKEKAAADGHVGTAAALPLTIFAQLLASLGAALLLSNASSARVRPVAGYVLLVWSESWVTAALHLVDWGCTFPANAVFWLDQLRCLLDVIAILYFWVALLLNRIVALEPALGRPAGRGLRTVMKVGVCSSFVMLLVTVGDKTVGMPHAREIRAFLYWFTISLVPTSLVVSLRPFIEAFWLVAEAARGAEGRAREEAAVARATVCEHICALLSCALTTPPRLTQRVATMGMWPWEERWGGLEGYVDCLDTLANCLAALWLAGVFRGGLRAAREEERRSSTRARDWALASEAWAPHEDPRWQAKVRELSGRGITLEALLDFYGALGGVAPETMPEWDPEWHTTADVVRQAIIPQSAEAKSAMATVLMKGVPAFPAKMVTHNWGNCFTDLVAAICADGLGEDEFGRVRGLLLKDRAQLRRWLEDRGQLKTAYWVCAFSVNQHLTICGANPHGGRDTVTGEPYPLCNCGLAKALNDTPPLTACGRGIECEVNKFDEMMRLLSAKNPNFEQVVAIDGDFQLFTRAWCLAELAAAHGMGMRQRLKLRFAGDLEGREEQLRGIRIQDMQASRPEDKGEILAGIPDAAAFDAALQNMLFDDLLPEWRCLDGEQQMHRVAMLARWQRAVRRTISGRTLSWRTISGHSLERERTLNGLSPDKVRKKEPPTLLTSGRSRAGVCTATDEEKPRESSSRSLSRAATQEKLRGFSSSSLSWAATSEDERPRACNSSSSLSLEETEAEKPGGGGTSPLRSCPRRLGRRGEAATPDGAPESGDEERPSKARRCSSHAVGKEGNAGPEEAQSCESPLRTYL